MTTNRFLQTFVLAAALLTPLHSYSQENENPNQKRVEEVTEPAPVSGVKANIVPLIWRVTIGEAVVSVPLRSIEYYGVQIYDTDSQILLFDHPNIPVENRVAVVLDVDRARFGCDLKLRPTGCFWEIGVVLNEHAIEVYGHAGLFHEFA